MEEELETVVILPITPPNSNISVEVEESRSGSEVEVFESGIELIRIEQIGNEKLAPGAFYTQIKGTQHIFSEHAFNANVYGGYSTAEEDNDNLFEGLFQGNKRHGPGVVTHTNGFQDVGWWHDKQIVRLCQVILPEWIPSLLNNPKPEIKEKDFAFEEAWDNVYRFLRGLDLTDEITKHLRILYNEEYHQSADLVYCENDGEGDNKAVISTHALTKPEKEEQVIFKALIDRIHHEKEEIPHELESVNSIYKNLNKRFLNKFLSEEAAKSKENEYAEMCRAFGNTEVMRNILRHVHSQRYKDRNIMALHDRLACGDRAYFDNPGMYECACISFLSSCSQGRESDTYSLFKSFNLNPDLCDANGNSGIMYSVARDRVGMIQILSNFGADLNITNDEGLTPLTLSLLRYLSLLHHVDDWSIAFIEGYRDKTRKKQKGANCLSLDVIEHYNAIFFNDKQFKSPDFGLLQNDLLSLTWLYKNLNLKLPLQQDFQLPYTEKVYGGYDEYLFHFKPEKLPARTVVVPRKKKGKRFFEVVDLGRTLHPQLVDRLTVIFNTIKILLYYGANPNTGLVPLPSLFLALFTENPDLVENLLSFGADTKGTTLNGNLTVLHTLLSLPYSDKVIPMCQVLLQYNVDVNARTDATHWEDEKNFIMGTYTEEVVDYGKTSLHILALRDDYEADNDNYILKLTRLLITAGATIDSLYLGHTPLSLAILKGNEKCVTAFLDYGANPNEMLGEYMGSPLTVYVLKRYANVLPDLDVCKSILNLLVAYFGNPLMPTAGFDNAIEFLVGDEPQLADGSIYKEKLNRKKKITIQDELKQYILLLCRRVACYHFQSVAFISIIISFINNADLAQANVLNRDLAKLLTYDDAIRVLQIFIFKKFISLHQDDHYALLRTVMQFVFIHGYRPREKKSHKIRPKYMNVENSLKNLASYVPKCSRQLQPELDKDFGKYKFCFHCGFKDEKILLACPRCGLVYFCSEDCNRHSVLRRTQHRCGLVFYKSELVKYQDAVLNQGQYVNINECKMKESKRLIRFIRKGCSLKL